jgi:hypothetical protein
MRINLVSGRTKEILVKEKDGWVRYYPLYNFG